MDGTLQDLWTLTVALLLGCAVAIALFRLSNDAAEDDTESPSLDTPPTAPPEPRLPADHLPGGRWTWPSA